MDVFSIQSDYTFAAYLRRHLLWQRYYIEGFKKNPYFNYKAHSNTILPLILYEHTRNLKLNQIIEKLLPRTGRVLGNRKWSIGAYTLTINKKIYRIIIDARDGKYIIETAYKWCDFYFKANMWKDLQDKEKVFPIIYTNGIMNSRRQNYLITLRKEPKTHDIVFINRIWMGNGKDKYAMPEHQVRLFETLASLDCKKDLRAVFSEELPRPIAREYQKRLDNIGVTWSYKFVPPALLWRRIARSKISLFRAGKFLCIPWRMNDFMAMGTAVVFDKAPYSQWPVPLEEGKHYVSCDCGLNEDESLPNEDCYENIRNRITSLLNEPEKIEAIRENNMAYFDNYATPEKVAQYILDTVRNNI